jgi:hypothetical protein
MTDQQHLLLLAQRYVGVGVDIRVCEREDRGRKTNVVSALGVDDLTLGSPLGFSDGYRFMEWVQKNKEKIFTPDIRDEVSFYVRNGKPYVGVKDGPELLLTLENCDEWQVRANESWTGYGIRPDDIHKWVQGPLFYLTNLKAWVLGLDDGGK